MSIHATTAIGICLLQAWSVIIKMNQCLKYYPYAQKMIKTYAHSISPNSLSSLHTAFLPAKLEKTTKQSDANHLDDWSLRHVDFLALPDSI